MKKLKSFLDIFVLSGFIASFFYGFLNPLYISVILSRLDARVIAVGSFMCSAFPLLIGAALGNRRLFSRLYAVLPVVMIVELVVGLAAALVAAVDLAVYYLASMAVVGVFSASVVYLLQKIKEQKYRANRAGFDRRYGMADALGALAGSGLSIAGVSLLSDPLTIAVVGAMQNAVIYGLFLIMYRRLPEPRRRRADEEPHPWSSPNIPAPLSLAA